MTEWIVTSSAMVLIVIALRGLLKGKISLRLQYGLWALVLVRLLVPFSIMDSAISVANILEEVRAQPVIQEADDAVADYESAYEEAVRKYEESGTAVSDLEIRQEVQQELFDRTYEKLENEYAQAGVSVPEVQIREQTQQQVETVSLTALATELLPYLWVAGMAIVGAVLVISNLHFAWKLNRTRTPLNVSGVPLKVYLTDYVATPCLFGLLRPDIYLTREVLTDEQMRRHVLSHEMSHYRQLDHIWSVLRSVCLVLHWYNPLVWAAAILSKQDAELACDEATIRVLGESERIAYGQTLIGMTCVRRDPRSLMLTATTMLGTKKTLKERIALIAKKPRNAFLTLVACILVAAIAVGCTFTGAPAEPTEAELLEKCRQALEYIQNLEHFEITETLASEDPDVMLSWREGRYVHSGDDWYHFRTYPDWTWQYLYKNGQLFTKDITKAVPQEDIQYPEWTRIAPIEDYYGKHCWIMDLHWDGDKIEYMTYTGNGDGYEGGIFTPIAVSSDTEDGYDLISVILELDTSTSVTDVEEGVLWTLTFCFDQDTGNLVEVKNDIIIEDTEAHIAGYNGGVESADVRSTSTLTITSTDPDEVAGIIDDIYYGEIVTVVPTPEDPTEPTGPVTMTNEWDPLPYEGLDYVEYFSEPREVGSFCQDLTWVGQDGMTRYGLDFGADGLYIEILQEPYTILWTVPNSAEYGAVCWMLCDGQWAYGTRNNTELIRIDLKTGDVEVLFTADEMMCGPISDDSFTNIFILDRDWLYFLAKNDDSIGIYRLYLPLMKLDLLSAEIPGDTLPHFLRLRFSSFNQMEVFCYYLNPMLQPILLDTIHDPDSPYQGVYEFSVDSQEEKAVVDLTAVWTTDRDLEHTFYWFGPFDFLRIQLQEDYDILGNRMIVYNAQTGRTTDSLAWAKPYGSASPDDRSAFFADLLDGYWYWRVLGCTFDDPRNISMEHMFYNGLELEERTDWTEFTEEESSYLSDLLRDTWWGEDGWKNAHKLPASRLNEILQEYLGVSLSDVTIPDNWMYYSGTDSYYVVHTDAYSVSNCGVTRVADNDDGSIRVYYTVMDYYHDTSTGKWIFEDTQMLLTLQLMEDGHYQVLSNEIDPDSITYLLFTNPLGSLFKSDRARVYIDNTHADPVRIISVRPELLYGLQEHLDHYTWVEQDFQSIDMFLERITFLDRLEADNNRYSLELKVLPDGTYTLRYSSRDDNDEWHTSKWVGTPKSDDYGTPAEDLRAFIDAYWPETE